jgi:hypothetical protein
MFPTFIHIGPGRSGSTMLYEAFKEHPEIGMAKNTKETNFFNNEYHRGIQWYEFFFAHCEGKKAIGEISNTYVYDPQVPARIAGLLPAVKLITVLRNPFDRIQSAYGFRKRSGEIDLGLSFEDALEEYPSLITDNYYGTQLRWFLEYFPKESLLVMFFDDLEEDAIGFVRDIFAFIGVDSDFEPASIYERVNRAARVRHPILASIIRFSADKLRQWQLYTLLDRIKSSEVLRELLFKPVSLNQMDYSQRTRKLLEGRFTPQIRTVEQITGRSLGHWIDGVK